MDELTQEMRKVKVRVKVRRRKTCTLDNTTVEETFRYSERLQPEVTPSLQSQVPKPSLQLEVSKTSLQLEAPKTSLQLEAPTPLLSTTPSISRTENGNHIHELSTYR